MKRIIALLFTIFMIFLISCNRTSTKQSSLTDLIVKVSLSEKTDTVKKDSCIKF